MYPNSASVDGNSGTAILGFNVHHILSTTTYNRHQFKLAFERFNAATGRLSFNLSDVLQYLGDEHYSWATRRISIEIPINLGARNKKMKESSRKQACKPRSGCDEIFYVVTIGAWFDCPSLLSVFRILLMSYTGMKHHCVSCCDVQTTYLNFKLNLNEPIYSCMDTKFSRHMKIQARIHPSWTQK